MRLKFDFFVQTNISHLWELLASIVDVNSERCSWTNMFPPSQHLIQPLAPTRGRSLFEMITLVILLTELHEAHFLLAFVCAAWCLRERICGSLSGCWSLVPKAWGSGWRADSALPAMLTRTSHLSQDGIYKWWLLSALLILTFFSVSDASLLLANSTELSVHSHRELRTIPHSSGDTLHFGLHSGFILSQTASSADSMGKRLTLQVNVHGKHMGYFFKQWIYIIHMEKPF